MNHFNVSNLINNACSLLRDFFEEGYVELVTKPRRKERISYIYIIFVTCKLYEIEAWIIIRIIKTKGLLKISILLFSYDLSPYIQKYL